MIAMIVLKTCCYKFVTTYLCYKLITDWVGIGSVNPLINHGGLRPASPAAPPLPRAGEGRGEGFDWARTCLDCSPSSGAISFHNVLGHVLQRSSAGVSKKKAFANSLSQTLHALAALRIIAFSFLTYSKANIFEHLPAAFRLIMRTHKNIPITKYVC